MHPRERQLSRRDALLVGNLLELLVQLEVIFQVLAAEPRVIGAPVAGVEGSFAGEEAAPEGGVRDDADAQLSAPKGTRQHDVSWTQRMSRRLPNFQESFAGEEAVAEGGVRDDANAELSAQQGHVSA